MSPEKAKSVRLTIGAIAAISLVAFVVWAYGSYQEYQVRKAVTERKWPFAGVVVVGIADAESLLMKKGVLKPKDSDAPRVACSLEGESCGNGLVRRYAIEADGVVRIELSGSRVAALEGKKILLTPRISGGSVEWKCLTDVSPDLVPGLKDPAGVQGGRCDAGKPDWQPLPVEPGKAKGG